jgi:anti-sigma B factor antagonist
MGPTLCVRAGGSVAVARIEGEIDVCVADRLQELLLRITQAYGPRLLLDLSAVSFMDCAGLRALVLTLRHAELCGWSIHLIAASAMVRRIITLTGAEDALPVLDQSGNSSGSTPGAARTSRCADVRASQRGHDCPTASAHSGPKEVPR